MKRKIEIIRRLADITPIKDLCGMISVLSSAEDFKKASLAVAMMSGPTVPHYHKRITEFYYVLEGEGKLMTGRNTHRVSESALIIIYPYTAHYTIPKEEMRVLAFAVPAWTEKDKDQFVLAENDVSADYSPFKERGELIEELLERSDMGFNPGISRKDREDMDIERLIFVKRAGYARMTNSELRGLLARR